MKVIPQYKVIISYNYDRISYVIIYLAIPFPVIVLRCTPLLAILLVPLYSKVGGSRLDDVNSLDTSLTQRTDKKESSMAGSSQWRIYYHRM